MRSFYFIIVIIFSSCSTTKYLLTDTGFPKAPDYNYIKNWVVTPKEEIPLPKNYFDTLKSFKSDVDVFYLYPTVYNSAYNGNFWNVNVDDPQHQRRVKELAIGNQASIFSGLTNVYSPLYRQIFYDGLVFYDASKTLMDIAQDPILKNDFNKYKKKIFSNNSLKYFSFDNDKQRIYSKESYELAYSDIKRAFLKYLEFENKGKNFIIAAHSQGSMHAKRLINDIVMPNEEIKDKLLLAYLVGIPIAENFSDLPPCSSPAQIKCFLSWNTFGDNVNPYDNEYYKNIVATNPVTFDQSEKISDIMIHKGILLPNIVQMFKYQVMGLSVKNFKLKKPNKISVISERGSLQIKEIKIPWIKIFKMESYHSADYNLFWLNIRENLHFRLSNYFKK
tara:strand:- start:516 stop:1685 length:1170 start_codon:yes stop_codon:yes gene_type:complete